MKLSIVVPCYNEADNIPLMYEALTELMREKLAEYDYEILFLDNKSQDNSRDLLRKICKEDLHVKAILHRVNCGPNTNPFHGLRESDGDCTVLIDADFQEPVEMIPVMVRKWEEGHKVICMIKTRSRENHFVYICREIYYRIFKFMSKIPQISQFTGFGLYDRSFIEVIRQLHDATPFVKGIVAEYAPDRIEMEYEQQRRKKGKSSLNFWGYYDSAMLSFTSYTRGGLRAVTLIGFAGALISVLIGLYYFCRKLLEWDTFAAGNIPILLSVLFLGGCQFMLIGLLGEYIININTRVIDRPMIVEEERINFEEKEST